MANPKPVAGWKPGQSGNPKGRAKKGKTLTDVLRVEVGKMRELDDGQRVSTRVLLAQKLIELSLEGDAYAMKYLYDRLDGKPLETIDERRIVEHVSIGLPPGAGDIDSEND